MNASGTLVNIVIYLAVFGVVGVLFLFVNLVVGWLLRPRNPHPEKLEIYECGEPTIGSGFVQFDLRFYVVALLFIIFDVEVAFFFPWALVFGKANHLADGNTPIVATARDGKPELTPTANGLYRELGVRNPTPVLDAPKSLADAVPKSGTDLERATAIARAGGKQLAWVTLADIAFFFAVLMIGFAYVWKRGDLDWVRHVIQDRRDQMEERPLGAKAGDPLEEELVAS